MNDVPIPLADLGRAFGMLDHIPLGVFVIAQDMTVVHWNKWMEELTKINRKDIVGKKITDAYPHLKEPKYAQRIEPIFQGAPPTVFSSLLHRYIIPVPHKGGEYRAQNTIVTPIPSPGGDTWALFAIQDVTDITFRIGEVKAMRDKALEAKDEAERATALKDKFVSLVAHDLRSPLSSIIGYIALMETDAAEPPTPNQRDLIKRLQEISVNMIGVIDDLLKISKIQSGKLAPHREFVDAGRLISANMANLSFLAEKKGITLENEVPRGSRLYADPALACEVIGNLLSNAIKFCRKDDAIRIFIPPDKKTVIAVMDTGTGINPKLLPDLFKHEVKTSVPGTAQELGTGLGLPYSNDIMKAHGGRLSVESTPGKGSVFYAEFPPARPVALVVDDTRTARVFLAEMLDKMDFEILEADNGKEALETISRKKPHLIISDVNMPVMDGFGLLESVKSNPATASIPFLMVSAENDAATNEKVIQLGADDFIAKTSLAQDFIPRVKKLIA